MVYGEFYAANIGSILVLYKKTCLNLNYSFVFNTKVVRADYPSSLFAPPIGNPHIFPRATREAEKFFEKTRRRGIPSLQVRLSFASGSPQHRSALPTPTGIL